MRNFITYAIIYRCFFNLHDCTFNEFILLWISFIYVQSKRDPNRSSDLIRCLSIVHGFFLAIAFNYTLRSRLTGEGGGKWARRSWVVKFSKMKKQWGRPFCLFWLKWRKFRKMLSVYCERALDRRKYSFNFFIYSFTFLPSWNLPAQS